MIKNIILFIILIISVRPAAAQKTSAEYINLVKKADSLYDAKDYKMSAFMFSSAFSVSSALPRDRYNAACSWALADYPDSAFYQLDFLATKANYINYVHITKDSDLNSLHNDSRWQPLLDIIKENKAAADAKLNLPLKELLDSIYTEDQKYRGKIDEAANKFGRDSEEMKSLWKVINETDSINLIKVKAILDNYGWLGADIVGDQGNVTLFLVIQHSDQATQEKYLPMMRDAVKNNNAAPGDLALLEDRVLLGQGERQIYGSQIGWDQETGNYFMLPLEDPDNVDERRAEAGLQPLADYLKFFKMTWEVEQYKKDLPEIEAKQKALNNK